MKVTAKDSRTGKSAVFDAPKVDQDFLKSMSIFDLTDEDIRRRIDGLNVSADVKALLYAFSKATITAGKFIIKVGRKILDLVCTLTERFPNASFGLFFGAIAGLLVSSIPVLGIVLGPILTPIALAIGLVLGLSEDIKDMAMRRSIEEAVREFSPLNAQA